jgi:dolichol-phosphate mannosyltransferase
MAKTAVVIPTFKEAESLEKFGPGLNRILSMYRNGNGKSLSVLVVDDDSPDGTAEAARRNGFGVMVRHGEKGLASAVIDGINSFNGDADNIIVMDADGQHDIDLIPSIVEKLESYDVVVPSRYVRGGGIDGWSRFRRLTSSIANLLALPLLPKVKDRTTGYFGIRKKILKDVKLDRDIGYKIGLEILVKSRYESLVEIPYTFKPRTVGKSKFNSKQTLLYLKHLAKLYFSSRLVKFLCVGASGAVVNLGLSYLLVSILGLNYLVGYPIAFLASVISNYVLNSAWSFRDRESSLAGLGKYTLVSVVTLAVNEVLIYALTDLLGLWYLFSTGVAILTASLLNFVLSRRIVWVKEK